MIEVIPQPSLYYRVRIFTFNAMFTDRQVKKVTGIMGG